jgi:hypothetical protein
MRAINGIFAASLFLGTLHAEIIDRIAATVGDHVISEQQVLHEIRIAAFLNRESPNVSAATKPDAAERLVKQELIRQEMEETHYPLPDRSEAGPLEKQVIENYGGETTYTAALAASGLTRDDVRNELWWQLTTLRFIDYRFRPAVHVAQSAISTYYDQQVEKWKAQGQKNIPSLEDSRESIEKILTEDQVDQALDHWLAEQGRRLNVRYRGEALQ